MKFQKLMLGLLAGAMFASCSDDVSQSSNVGPDAKGSGYVSIAIGMPTGAGTRANDQFDDGRNDEYTVNNIAILFFTGREEDATFYRAYNVRPNPGAFERDTVAPQITAIKKVTFPVEITETNESLWALAVVNYGSIGMTIVEEQGNEDNGKIKFDNVVFSGNITDFMKRTTNKELSSPNNFLMVNTPYTTAPGSGVDAPTGMVHLLASVDKEKIKESEELAAKEPAAEIFVERAVAKVEVNIVADDYNALGVNVNLDEVEWILDNTEPTSYIVRRLDHETVIDGSKAPYWMSYDHVDGFESDPMPIYGYRFVGNTVFNRETQFYRLYFGMDPNGNGIGEGSSLKVLQDSVAAKAPFKKIGLGNPQYCYENTFDVVHQDYRNTTRVLLKVPFQGGTFYTRGIDRKTKYTFENAAVTLGHFVLENSDVVDAYTAYFNEGVTVSLTNMTYDKDKLSASNEWISLQYKIEEGRLRIAQLQLFDGKGNSIELLEGVNVEDVIANINEQVTFNAYVGGVSYYAVRIQHFGDDLTPWVSPKNGDGTDKLTETTADSYGTGDAAERNYLGRWGVLRNNWYQVNINLIEKFGEPTIKDLPLDGTPDDKNDPEKAISCKINILSWAKRSQDVEL